MVMVALVTAGETIFLLPFVVARVFRPTMLDVFGLTNFQLGTAFSLYGIVAMVSYALGGPLADRFPARRLLTAALVATSAGGVSLASIPSLPVLRLLLAYWGMTTILLFWAALIRATREWGGPASQGRAYGVLDGGRGLAAALVSSISVAIFAALLPTDVAAATLADRASALTWIIHIYSAVTFGVAVLVWFAVPEVDLSEEAERRDRLSWDGVRRVVGMKAVWLQAVIVVCAYVAYKSTDDFSLLARDAFGYDDVEAARIGTISFWVRPFAAVGAGILGDRITSSRAIILSFAVLIVGSLGIASGYLRADMSWMIVGTVAGTSVGIYALRGIYFALFQQARVPLVFTGSAVGLVSVVGYTPDVFMGPVMGWLLDRSPGALGHQHVFAMVAGFAAVGLIATLMFEGAARESAQPVAAEAEAEPGTEAEPAH
jgi:nitrate/nitrite transporter NarK